MKQINRPPVGNYPVALVPGQFTDYYKVANNLNAKCSTVRLIVLFTGIHSCGVE